MDNNEVIDPNKYGIKSKERILRDWTGSNTEPVLNAMESYAQQEAASFSAWTSVNGWVYMPAFNHWRKNRIMGGYAEKNFHELYKLFKTTNLK